MQLKKVNKENQLKGSQNFKFRDFVSTEGHFASTHRRCFVKKGVLV